MFKITQLQVEKESCGATLSSAQQSQSTTNGVLQYREHVMRHGGSRVEPCRLSQLSVRLCKRNGLNRRKAFLSVSGSSNQKANSLFRYYM